MNPLKIMTFNYKKYRWFFTKSGKLVYGGKSAIQNEEIVGKLMKDKEDLIVMHTKDPGSPFAIVKSPINELTQSDLDECAIWCASFSRKWREGAMSAKVDIFKKSQIKKRSNMKDGTFGVMNKMSSIIVDLRLILTDQNDILRAIPEESLKSDSPRYAKIVPGKITKEEFAVKIAKRLKKSITETLNALPTGKFKEIKK